MRGFPGGVHVTNSGEVFTLVLRDTTLVALIRDGEVAWSKELPSRYWWTALSTPEGSRFVVSGAESTYIFDRDGKLISYYRDFTDKNSILDNCYILTKSHSRERIYPFPSSYITLLSPSGKEIYHADINNVVHTRISPNGRYFVAVTSDGLVYFFENQKLIINERREELIKKIDELLQM